MTGRKPPSSAVPLTEQILALIIAIQQAGKASVTEVILREALRLPLDTKPDWVACAKAVFDAYAPHIPGIDQNAITFEAMLRCQIPEQVRRTAYTDLPVRFSFDPWAGMGYGGIVEREASASAHHGGS